MRCHKHDIFLIKIENECVGERNTNFVVVISEKIIHEISLNFMFRFSLTLLDANYNALHITQQTVLLHTFTKNDYERQILPTVVWNRAYCIV